MAESFLNAESAFRDAFNQPNPTPKLLELIRAHPQLPTITHLVSVYMELAAECPIHIDKFARALVDLQTTSEVTIAAYDAFGNPAQQNIAPLLNRELAGFHSGDLVAAEDTSITTSNDYLVASLLSATSMKYRLCDSPAQAGAVVHGLHFKDRRYRDDAPASREILLLGACLQLLVAGSYLYGPTGTDAGKVDVLKALQDIQSEGIVKSQNGQRLLEVRLFYLSILHKNLNEIYARPRFNKPRMASRTMLTTLGVSYFHKRRDWYRVAVVNGFCCNSEPVIRRTNVNVLFPFNEHFTYQRQDTKGRSFIPICPDILGIGSCYTQH